MIRLAIALAAAALLALFMGFFVAGVELIIDGYREPRPGKEADLDRL